MARPKIRLIPDSAHDTSDLGRGEGETLRRLVEIRPQLQVTSDLIDSDNGWANTREPRDGSSGNESVWTVRDWRWSSRQTARFFACPTVMLVR
jgi:hypothetical protein